MEWCTGMVTIESRLINGLACPFHRFGTSMKGALHFSKEEKTDLFL